MEVLAELGHTFDEFVFGGDQRMVFKVIDEVFLAVLAQKVELNLL